MESIEDIINNNGGIVGHVTVADAYALEASEVAYWANRHELVELDGIWVFRAKDIESMLEDIEDEDDEDEEEEELGDDAEDEGHEELGDDVEDEEETDEDAE